MKRLEYDASTKEEIAQYFQTRARQLLMDGFVWDRTLVPVLGGFETSFEKDGIKYGSFYGLGYERGHGYAIEAFKRRAPIVTSWDCHIVDFLNHHQIPHVVKGDFLETLEYKMIAQYYGDKKAKRSGCYLMNHIDEGLFVLQQYGASEEAKKAFCIHPMIQMDQDLKENFDMVKDAVSAEILALAMEYRNIANQYLSMRTVSHLSEISLSPLLEVNDMLRADKVQNYKDFLTYHHQTHPRSEILDEYFQTWLAKLDISKDEFESLRKQMLSIEGPIFAKPKIVLP